MSGTSGKQRYPLEFLLLLVAFLIIAINVFLVVLTLIGSYYSFAIVGNQNLRVQILTILVAIILASAISCLATLCSFVTRKPLPLQNACALTIPALIVHILLIPIWTILLLSPMSDLETKMMKSLTEGYQNETSWDAWSVAWNVIQTTHGRCGVNSPVDWKDSEWYQTGASWVPVFCCEEGASDDLVTKTVEHQLTEEDIANVRTKCLLISSSTSSQLTETQSTKPTSGDSQTVSASRPSKAAVPITTGVETAVITTKETATATTNSETSTRTETAKTTTFQYEETVQSMTKLTVTSDFKSPTDLFASTATTTSVTAKQPRVTKFREPRVGSFDTSNLPYSNILSWSDPFKEVDARFYFPATRRSMTWLDAIDYCDYYTQYMEPTRDFVKTPAGLAVGFNSDEIEFLSSKEAFKSASKPHLGMYRPITDTKDKDMFVAQYPHIKVREKSFFGNWADSEPDMAKKEVYGAMNIKNGLRYDSKRGVKRSFICVNYTELTADSIPELEYTHGVRYQKLLNGTILADYRIVHDQLEFEDARRRCFHTFGSYDLAIGFDQTELDFLAEIANISEINTDAIHIGIKRRPEERMFGASYFDKVFGRLWAPKEPSNDEGEHYGCLDMKYKERCDERAHRERFVCATYEKFPEDPFPPVTKDRKWSSTLSTHKADPNKIIRPQLGEGTKTEVKLKEVPKKKVFSKIFDWKDTFETIGARYYQPLETTTLPWVEANQLCRSEVPKLEPSRIDYSKHPPIIAVGFTTEELEMLHRLEYLKKAGDSPHLGFARELNSSTGKPLSSSVKVSGYDVLLSKLGFHNLKKREAIYVDEWAVEEPDMRSGEVFGCMVTSRKQRKDCHKDSTTFICANYTYSPEPFYRKTESELKKLPMVMYQRYVNDFLFAEYWLVDKKMEFGAARNHCGEVYGPGFDLAVGFDSDELKFIADIAKEGKLSTKTIHMGFSRSNGMYYVSVVFDKHFRTMWSKNEPSEKDKKGVEEYFGCLKSQDYLGRADCEAKNRTFICAVYDKVNIGLTLDLEDASDANAAAGSQRSNQLRDLENGPGSVNQKGCLEVVKNQIVAFSIPLTVLFMLNFFFLFIIFLFSCLLVRKISK